jgi:hypothetical protein
MIELEQSSSETVQCYAHSFTSAIRLGSKHTVVGSLSNITNGGPSASLLVNLAVWKNLTSTLYQHGTPILSFSPQNTTPYLNGVHLSWDTPGSGVSSAYINFNLSLSDQDANLQTQYALNITTSVIQDGKYRTLQGDEKQVNVTCYIYNEAHPALAENITIYYDYMGTWLRADNQTTYTHLDYGNGTYSISFEATIPGSSVNVQAFIDDLRGIHVRTNSTCTEV